MSYRAGTRGLGFIGIPDGDPRVICDGCGKAVSVVKPGAGPYAWLINRRKVPGWFKLIPRGEGRVDYCTEKCERAASSPREGDRT